MQISPFLLERHFARYEFEVPFQLSCSDCEPLNLSELLTMASPDTLSLWQNMKLSYTESAGHPLLRQEISMLYEGIRAEDILICVPEEGIFLLMNSLLAPGDHIVVISPAYQSLHEIADGIGCKVSFWEADEDGKYQVESLKSVITAVTRMVVINFPHNPTGALIDTADLIEIACFCDCLNITLFSDEMYRGLEQNVADQLPCTASLNPGSIALSGMSKSFALPGLRIGWLVCRNREVREKLIQLKDYTTICASGPSEILAIIALQNKEKILAGNLAIIAENMRLVNDFADRNAYTVSWNAPRAGSVALLHLLKGISAEELCRDLREKKGVLAIGSHLFNYPKPAIRLGLGRIGFVEALRMLEELIIGSKI